MTPVIDAAWEDFKPSLPDTLDENEMHTAHMLFVAGMSACFKVIGAAARANDRTIIDRLNREFGLFDGKPNGP